jgi:hypothetical protein
MLHNLKDNEFRYNTFVSRCDDKQTCGTTCCVAGWYPHYFPKSDLLWRPTEMGNLRLEGKNMYIEGALELYHGLSNAIIAALFYGDELRVEKKVVLKDDVDMESTLSDVIHRFEVVINLIERDRI